MYFSETYFVVKPSDKSFEYWLSQNFISSSAREELESANLLITPQIGHPAVDGPLFPERTREFLEYCSDQVHDGMVAKLCLGDAEFVELLLRSYDIFLPDVIVERVIIPIYVKVMSGYLTEKLQTRFGNDIRVNTKVTIVDSDRSIATEFSYRGKPGEYEKTVASTLKLIESSADLQLAGETEDLNVEERIERLSNESET